MYNLPSTNTPMHLLEKQRAFLSAKATIVGFCGPHACGKTTSLLTAAFEVCGDLEARAMISTLIATMQPQSLFAEAKTLYPHLNLPIEQKAHMRINFASRSFQWPNYQQTPMRVYHSQMRFAMVADALLPQYEGLHFDFVGIDNLEFFTQHSLLFLLARLRNWSATIQPGRLMTTFSQPAGDDPLLDEQEKRNWPFRFFLPWFAGDHVSWADYRAIPRADSGEIRYFVRKGDAVRWLLPGEEQFEPEAVSATVIR